jgi:type VII secretion integral membrane protein EccD
VTAPVGVGLSRVTVAAPQRRVDVALPDHILVADLLPHLLRHAGIDSVEDDLHGGWTLRRTSGLELDADSDLSTQGVRDGELLHLAPRRQDWPEPAYDDVVEVIASSARRTGRSWGGTATRRTGLAVVGAMLLLGAGLLTWAGSPWLLPGVIGLLMAAVLTLSGVLLSRAGGDAVAGAVVAGYGLVYAALGGALVTAPDALEPGDFGAPQVIAGGAALILVSALAMIGVAALARIFTAGLGVGGAALLGGLLCLAGTSRAAAAAVLLTLAIGLLPAYPMLASTLGHIPLPVLPHRPEAILDDAPVPDRGSVFASVARASELLTGALLAASVVSVAAGALLLSHGGTTGKILALAGAGALLLRGRLFPAAAQRLPQLLAALAIGVMAALGWALQLHSGPDRLPLLIGLLVVAALVLAGTLAYSRRTPSPYMGRIADVLDVLAIMALIPLACGVLGIFQMVQAAFSSVS